VVAGIQKISAKADNGRRAIEVHSPGAILTSHGRRA
jgi:hypothetical protein